MNVLPILGSKIVSVVLLEIVHHSDTQCYILQLEKARPFNKRRKKFCWASYVKHWTYFVFLNACDSYVNVSGPFGPSWKLIRWKKDWVNDLRCTLWPYSMEAKAPSSRHEWDVVWKGVSNLQSSRFELEHWALHSYLPATWLPQLIAGSWDHSWSTLLSKKVYRIIVN